MHKPQSPPAPWSAVKRRSSYGKGLALAERKKPRMLTGYAVDKDGNRI